MDLFSLPWGKFIFRHTHYATNLPTDCLWHAQKNLFKKAQRRYRSSTNLPELVSPCVDFSLPDPLISDKPLVHVFLLQGTSALHPPSMFTINLFTSRYVYCNRSEFMRSDALSAVVEALNKALKLMHDDVHVLLMTYSGDISLFLHSLTLTVYSSISCACR